MLVISSFEGCIEKPDYKLAYFREGLQIRVLKFPQLCDNYEPSFKSSFAFKQIK